MEKDEKQDDRISQLERELEGIKVRQEGKVNKESCETSKGEINVTIITAVNEARDEIITEVRNLSPMSMKHKLGMMGGGAGGGMTIMGLTYLIIKYGPWGG